MGQEIVYCFRCQQRIVSSDYAKGLAYELENSSCCSTCAVELLETLQPQAKEQLLAKMAQVAQQRRQSKTSGNLKALKPGSSSGSTRKIPIQAAPKAPVALYGGLAAAGVVVLLLIVAVSTNTSPPPEPPPTVVEKRPQPPEVRPGPNPEEQRRAAAAKDAMQKARDFAAANPRELHGQVRQWKAALAEAAGTGYEAEAKREVEKAEGRVREELGELERRVGELTARKNYKGAQDLVAQAKPRIPAGAVDALERQIRDSAARAFTELREKALADRARGAKEAVDAAKAEVARWGFPDYVEELTKALQGAWIPIFDGKSTGFMSSGSVAYWKVENGSVVRAVDSQQAGQSREEFGDGEVRFRVRTGGPLSIFTASVRQQAGACRVVFLRDALAAMGEGEHEVIFTCRGLVVTATLDGKPTKVEVNQEVHTKGRLQFNGKDGEFRVLAIDYRPLP